MSDQTSAPPPPSDPKKNTCKHPRDHWLARDGVTICDLCGQEVTAGVLVGERVRR
jgi:hypothetical protein